MRSPLPEHNSLGVHLATVCEQGVPQPPAVWSSHAPTSSLPMTPAQVPSTHLHEMLLHVGCEVAQDTHLSLQLLRDGSRREHKVFAVGRVVMHSPGREKTMSFGTTQHQTHPWHSLPLPLPTRGASPETPAPSPPLTCGWGKASCACHC